MVTRMKNSKDWIRDTNCIRIRRCSTLKLKQVLAGLPCGMLSFVESYCRSWSVQAGLLPHEFATDQICTFLLYTKHSISNCEGKH